MVGVAGFEPATPASRTRCSTRLSHTPTWEAPYRGANGARQAGPNAALHRLEPCATSAPPRRGRTPSCAAPAGGWCNGNTAVFGTVILGSSPSPPATEFVEEFT